MSGDAYKKKKRIAIIGVSSLILVAMVVAVAVGVSKADENEGSHEHKGPEKGDDEVKTSMKAIEALCKPTQFQDTCIKTLTDVAGNTTDPKELVKLSFNVTMKHIRNAMKHSVTMQELEKDKSSKDALRICNTLMEYAMEDLEHAFLRSSNFDFSQLERFVYDLKVWLGGALTFQETCFDGFQNTTGTAGESMRKALQSSGELTANALGIVNEITKVISSFSFPISKRKLLSHGQEHPIIAKDGFPNWFTPAKRNLLAATPANINPNVVVAQDGSGQYTTINDALKIVPKKNPQPFIIYIKEGVYKEIVVVKAHNVTMIGDGPQKTKITGSKSYVGGYKTIETATFAAVGSGFVAKDIGFENSAGPNMHQAVALRVHSDESVIYNCQIDGFQDTLYAHAHRQFYRNCNISGTIDFIFGDGQTVLQNCKLIVRKPLDNQSNHVTAQGRKNPLEVSALILQGCTIEADPEYYPVRHKIKTFLGRPWKNFSRTIIMQTHMDDFIQPEGWAPWNQTENLDTCFYAEYQNKGPGAADLSKRVKWPCIKTITPEDAEEFSPLKYYKSDEWITRNGIPYYPGMLPS
ncbi:Pectinesterase/pectinesterase inhibitor [Thalictrum thalictroides]|uniref:Pectinesterase n=1 Tax=Thalictrum thalictroides TaxID=46969 RepID=A0A7J6VVC0_THATH|nr:Pectinesterase/pectinesterase inhibitor [Thalictrum thalictroides]